MDESERGAEAEAQAEAVNAPFAEGDSLPS